MVESIAKDNKKKVTAASILRIATKYVGNECQPKLRLHGRYETDDVIHVRLDTVCEDDTEIRGMLHFYGENIVAISARRRKAEGDNPHLEPVLFSFVKE